MELNISYKKIIGISLPVVIGMLIQNVISVTDTIFLSKVGEVALGGAAIGGMMYVVLTTIGMGFSIGIQIITGRRNGERNFRQIGSIIHHGFALALMLALILFLLFLFKGDEFLKQFVSSDAIYQTSFSYISIRSWALFISFSNYIFNSFYIGITKTKILTYAGIITAIVNIFLDYVLIFGYLGFPKMGVAGAAIASNIAEMSTLIFFIITTFRNKKFVNFYNLLEKTKIELSVALDIFKTSYPLMIQHFVSLGAWFIFFLIVEKISERALAISNIVRSIYIMMMIPMWGLAISANTLVSNCMGEGSYEKVMPLIKRITIICFSITILMILPVWIFINPIISIYTDNIELAKGVYSVMHILFFGLALLSLSVILFNGVSGTGNTKVSLLIEMTCIAIYLSYLYYVSLILKLGVVWVWTSECVYFVILMAMSFLYMKYGNWRNIKV